MPFKRRDFIQACTGLPWLIVPFSLASQDLAAKTDDISNHLMIGAGKYRQTKDSPIRYILSLVNYSSRKRHLIEMDFFAHGLAVNPKRPESVVLFEKKGEGACEVDILSRRVVRKIATLNERLFYGHGSYSADGRILFSTETYRDGLRGVIAVREAQSMNLLGEFPSYGNEPHECRLTHHGKTLVVTNGGSADNSMPPNIAYIDIASKKLLQRISLTNSRLNTGHIALDGKDQLVVVSAPRSGLATDDLGGVSMGNIAAGDFKGVLTSLLKPTSVVQRMKGEALSVVIQEKLGVAAVTHPDGDMVTFWSIPQQRLLKVINLKRPLGVALSFDQSMFLITYGDTVLLEVDSETLQPQYKQQIPMTYMSGSHIYNWSLEKQRMMNMSHTQSTSKYFFL